jgi:hypothetical protein
MKANKQVLQSIEVASGDPIEIMFFVGPDGTDDDLPCMAIQFKDKPEVEPLWLHKTTVEEAAKYGWIEDEEDEEDEEDDSQYASPGYARLLTVIRAFLETLRTEDPEDRKMTKDFYNANIQVFHEAFEVYKLATGEGEADDS